MEERYSFPWFPFYPADWFSSGRVKIMTQQEKGAYIDLLAYAWKSDACALPKHEAVLKSLASWPEEEYVDTYGVCPHNFQRVMACFEDHPDQPGMLCNLRLYKEWLKVVAQHRKLSQRGKKGAKKRWQQTEIKPSVQPAASSARKIHDREAKGFTPLGESLRALADKKFPPV